MKLYTVHCGYYIKDAGDGNYEAHVNMFVAAENFAEAKAKAKADTRFQQFKMHVDSIQELDVIDGHKIELTPIENANSLKKIGLVDYETSKTL